MIDDHGGLINCVGESKEEDIDAKWTDIEFWKRMQEYLTDIVRPQEISNEEFSALKRRSVGFFGRIIG